MVLVIGRVRCDAENRDQVIALSFVAVEEWADRDALDRHFAQPHLHEFARGLLERVAQRPEVAIHEVVETKQR
jgi:quinol monooxygenase YgiN